MNTKMFIGDEEVHLGDDVSVHKMPLLDARIFLDAEAVEKLKRLGIIRVINDVYIPLYIKYYVSAIATSITPKGSLLNGAYEFLERLERYNKGAYFSLLLKEIAITLDQKYTDVITKSSDIYTISTLNGKIYKLIKKGIKNYRNFAAFRSEEDAQIAVRILEPLLKSMFSDDRKQKSKKR